MKFNNQRLIENSRTYLSSEIIDPIYNTDQLMNLLTVSRRTVQNWRDKGLIAFLNTHKIDSYNGK